MKKISIYNNKGGVGKTTSVINIAYVLHQEGKKTLVVDCDEQKNCYMFFLSEENEKILPSRYSNIKHTTYNVFEKLAENEIQEFDYVIFDLPPVLDDKVLNIIRKSDKVFVPIMLRFFEISGLANLVSKCDNLGGVFITQFTGKKDQPYLDECVSVLQDRIMDTQIHFSQAVIDSQRAMLPVGAYLEARKTPKMFRNAWQSADEYYALTKEIMRRI